MAQKVIFKKHLVATPCLSPDSILGSDESRNTCGSSPKISPRLDHNIELHLNFENFVDD